MSETHFRGLCQFNLLSAATRSIPRATKSTPNPIQLHGKTAIVNVIGTIHKDKTRELMDTFKRIEHDRTVSNVLLCIDSPGGQLDSLADLSTMIQRGRKSKRLIAYCDDHALGAAYWIASQESGIYANSTAMIGDLGVYTTVTDSSKQAERSGLRVHVIRSGEHKGAGTPGTEITPEQLAEAKRLVDRFGKLFVESVARGRGVSESIAKRWADGRVHVGAQAKALGLINGVETFETTLARLSV